MSSSRCHSGSAPSDVARILREHDDLAGALRRRGRRPAAPADRAPQRSSAGNRFSNTATSHVAGGHLGRMRRDRSSARAGCTRAAAGTCGSGDGWRRRPTRRAADASAGARSARTAPDAGDGAVSRPAIGCARRRGSAARPSGLRERTLEHHRPASSVRPTAASGSTASRRLAIRTARRRRDVGDREFRRAVGVQQAVGFLVGVGELRVAEPGQHRQRSRRRSSSCVYRSANSLGGRAARVAPRAAARGEQAMPPNSDSMIGWSACVCSSEHQQAAARPLAAGTAAAALRRRGSGARCAPGRRRSRGCR